MSRSIYTTSDWHLDWRTAGFERFGDVATAAGAVSNFAIDRKASLFLFLGDLSDPGEPVSYMAGGVALRIACKLREAGIPSLWLTGNHDVTEGAHGASTLSVMDVKGELFRVANEPSVEHYDGFTVMTLPFTSTSNSYDPEKVVNKLARELKPEQSDGTGVLVAGHLNLEGITPGSETTDMARGRDVYYPVDTVRQLLPKAIMLNGHYHKAQTFNGVHIPGSLERLTFGEVGNRPGFLVIEV